MVNEGWKQVTDTLLPVQAIWAGLWVGLWAGLSIPLRAWEPLLGSSRWG